MNPTTLQTIITYALSFAAAEHDRLMEERVAMMAYRIFRRSDGALLAGYESGTVARRALRCIWGRGCEVKGSK